jgi:alginate O-acetyltransferase complex protein AlgI
VLTFVLVLVGWVFFRSESLSAALHYLGRMFNVFEYWSSSQFVWRSIVIHNEGIFVFAAATSSVSPRLPRLCAVRAVDQALRLRAPMEIVRFAGCSACLALSACTLAATDYTPFIYFRF